MKSYFAWRSKTLLRNLDEEHLSIQVDIKEAVKLVSETTQLNNVLGRELLYTATVTNTILQMIQSLITQYSTNLNKPLTIHRSNLNELIAELDSLCQLFKIQILSNPKLHILKLEKLIEHYSSSRGQIRMQLNNVKYSFESFARTENNTREEGALDKPDLMKFRIEAMCIFIKIKEIEENWDKGSGETLVQQFNMIGDRIDILNEMYNKCLNQVLYCAKKKGIDNHCITDYRIVKRNKRTDLEDNVQEIQETMNRSKDVKDIEEIFINQPGKEDKPIEAINTRTLRGRSRTLNPDCSSPSRINNLTLSELRSKLNLYTPGTVKYRTVDEKTGEVINLSETFYTEKTSRSKERSVSPKKRLTIDAEIKSIMSGKGSHLIHNRNIL